MPRQVEILLDGGCFLPLRQPGQTFSEIGYYECKADTADFIVHVDGAVREFRELRKLKNGVGGQCEIHVTHNAPGSNKVHGVRFSKQFHDDLLHLGDLYGCTGLAVDRTKFDCVLRFNCGRFSSVDLMKRKFRKYDGNYNAVADSEPLYLAKHIMHDMLVSFTLREGEEIELSRNGNVFWSTAQSGMQNSLRIDICADDSTVPKFFCKSFAKAEDGGYWAPNPGDPPPICSEPPCQRGTG